MLISGLCSISFRSLSCAELLELTLKAGLKAIEWGGDVHCPHGDVAIAKEIAEKCKAAGIDCPSYGSYYKCCDSGSPEFEDVARSSQALGASIIRIWAGTKSPKDADENYWHEVAAEANRIAAIAAKYSCKIAFEYHQNTLTETKDSTAKLMQMLPDSNILFYWQPPHGNSVEDCLAGMHEVLPRLANLHVFYWGAKGWSEKYMLAEGKERWDKFLNTANPKNGKRYAFLEFAKDDKTDNMLQDAAILNDIINNID